MDLLPEHSEASIVSVVFPSGHSMQSPESASLLKPSRHSTEGNSSDCIFGSFIQSLREVYDTVVRVETCGINY